MIQTEEPVIPSSNANVPKKIEKFMPRLSSVSKHDIKNLSQDDQYLQSELDELKEQKENKFNQLFRSVNEYENLCVIWSNAIMLSNIYNFITCCYYLGIPGFPTSEWLYFEFTIEIILLIDLSLRALFNTYLKRQWINMGLVHDQNQEALIQKFYYLMSSIPTSIIIYSILPQSRLSDVWIAFLRLFKVLRINQLNQYFDVRDIRTKRNSFLRTAQSIIQIFLVTHLLGCFWLFVGRVDPNQSQNWMSLEQYDLYDAPDLQKYIDSVFFVISAMTGLGFAYIYP